MRKQLIIGTVPENFNPEFHIPIKPACFLGNEHIYPDFHKLDFVNSLENKSDYPNIDKLTNDEALRMVEVSAKHFYPAAYTKFSFRFWKSIFYPWLSLFVPYLYREQLLIKKIIEKNKYTEIDVYIKKKEFDEIPKFISVSDIIAKGLRNIHFNEFIVSFFIESLAPENWRLIYKSNIQYSFNNQNISKKNVSKKLLQNILEQWLFRAKKSYGFTLFDRILLHYTLALKKPIESGNKSNFEIPVNKIDWAININELIFSLTPESLKNIDLYSPPRKYKRGKIANYSNQLYISSSIDAAYAYEAGEIVIADQHGGHLYGSATTSESLFNVEYSADYFLSWGWQKYKEKIQNNIIPLPSPLLSKIYNKHLGVSDELVFVGTSMNLLKNNFNSAFSDIEMLQYRLNKLKFIKAYKKEFGLINLKYRPYAESNFSLADSTFLLKKHPELKILRGEKMNFHSLLRKSSALVIDHTGTTLNIAMALNIPILLFWKKEWFPLNEDSLLFLKEFEKLGIYHETVESLIKKMKNIKSNHLNFSDWWMQNDIQELRMRWLNQYGLTDKNWRKQWFSKLWNLK